MTKAILRCAVLINLAFSAASAGPIFSRPLTNTPGNIVTFRPSPSYINYVLGDDFSIGSSTVVTDLSVWITGTSMAVTNPNQEFNAINLYLGEQGPGILSQAATTYSFASAGTFANPNLAIDQPIFKLTFSGLNFAATAGVVYDFVVEGIPIVNTPSNQLALTSTLCNPTVLGACNINGGDSADGVFVAYSTVTPGTGPYNVAFTIPGSPTDPGPFYDINVEINNIPEPSTIALMTMGFGALGFYRRRRFQSRQY